MSSCALRVGEYESTVHFCGIGKIGHDDSCRRSEVIMVSVENKAFNISTSTITIISTRISGSIFQVQKGIISGRSTGVKIISVGISKREFKD